MALSTSTAGTGCGFDQLPPRQLSRLPVEAPEMSRQLISAIERQEAWPPMTTRLVSILSAARRSTPPLPAPLSLSRASAHWARYIAAVAEKQLPLLLVGHS
eukprot:7342691-Pyramimonas_sp.AAC.1